MKKLKILIASAILLLVTTVALTTGCQKNYKEPNNKEINLIPQSVPKVLHNVYYNNLKIPDGTTTEVINSGSAVKLKFPPGIFLVGTTSSGEISKVDGTEYTCTGDCTIGCDVFLVGNTFGCSACNPAEIVCTGKAKSLEKVQGKGFVNFNAGISFVKNEEEASSLYAGPDALFRVPEIRKAMKAFNLKIHGIENPDFSDSKQFREVKLNFFGCLVIYMAPSKSNPNASKVEEDLIEPKNWSCRCDAPPNSSGCTEESGQGYKKCVSGACTSCTMIVEQ